MTSCRDSLALAGTSVCLVDDAIGLRNIARAIRGIRDANPRCACVVLTDSLDHELHSRYSEYGAAEIILWQDTVDSERAGYNVFKALKGGLQRTLLEADLKAVSQRHEFAWRKSPSPFFRIEGEGHVLACNQPFAELLGYSSPNEIMGTPLLEMEQGTATRVFPFRPKNSGSMRTCCLRKKDGESVVVELIDQVSPGDHAELRNLANLGGPTYRLPVREGFVATQGSVELELRQRLTRYEAIYNSLFSAMAEGFVIADARGRLNACNIAAEATLGIRLREVQGHHIDDVLAFDACDDDSLEFFSQIYDGKERLFKLRKRTADGDRGSKSDHQPEIQPVWVRCRASLVAVPGASSVVRRSQFLVSVIDVSAQVAAERRSEISIAKSQLAAGVSHDMRNYLTAIASSASLLKTTLRNEEPGLREYVDQIEDAALLSASLLDQVVRVARPESSVLGSSVPGSSVSDGSVSGSARLGSGVASTLVDFDGAVEGIQLLLGSLLSKRVKLAVRLGAEGVKVRGISGTVEQLLINLVLNASQALDELDRTDGQIGVATETVLLQEDNRYSIPAGRAVVLSVSDNGPGIDRETQHKMFEPFFTSRAGGSGLGLSMVREIVESQLGGGILCESIPGEGANFKVAIPVA